MDEIVQGYTAEALTAGALRAALTAGSGEWLYGERADDTVLQAWPPAEADAFDLARYKHARLFGAVGELAWWRLAEDVFAARLLTAGDAPGGSGWSPDGHTYTLKDEAGALLHGLWDEGSDNPPTWSEARLPRYFAYPVGSNRRPTLDSRAVLVARRYVDETGRVVSRLTAVGMVETAPLGGS